MDRSYYSGISNDIILEFPVYAYLIAHPKGNILFDTGLPLVVWQGKTDVGLDSGLKGIPGDSAGLLEEIAKKGFSAEDVAILINSHNHHDHAGANLLFPGSRYVPAVKENCDIFGDGSVCLLPTPGHSPDHQCLLVRGQYKQVLLIGDACFRAANLYELLPPMIVDDPEEALRSLEMLRDITKIRETVVLTAHDSSITGDPIIF